MNVPFIASARDCMLQAELRLDQERLQDLLATGSPLRVADATLRAHEDGHVVDAGSIEVDQHELMVVIGTGPSGNPARRLSTVSKVMAVTVGPYRVVGSVHAPASVDLMGWMERRPWFAMTGAVLTYVAGGRRQAESHEVVLVNREHVVKLAPADPGEHELERAAGEQVAPSAAPSR